MKKTTTYRSFERYFCKICGAHLDTSAPVGLDENITLFVDAP